jgi:hypothetical protein
MEEDTVQRILLVRSDIVAGRVHFLRQIKKYRYEGRKIVYTDETFLHTIQLLQNPDN